MQPTYVVSIAARKIIDVMTSSSRTLYSGETIEQLKHRYPDVAEMAMEEASEAIENCFIDKVAKEISEEAFMDALECLPPKKWVQQPGSESFMFCEHTYGSVTSIFVRIDRKFYRFSDRSTLSHKEIVERVAKTCPGEATQ